MFGPVLAGHLYYSHCCNICPRGDPQKLHCTTYPPTHTHTQSYLLTLSEANEELPSLREQAVTLRERVVELEAQVKGITEDLEREREEHARRVEELTNENEETMKVGVVCTIVTLMQW